MSIQNYCYSWLLCFYEVDEVHMISRKNKKHDLTLTMYEFLLKNLPCDVGLLLLYLMIKLKKESWKI